MWIKLLDHSMFPAMYYQFYQKETVNIKYECFVSGQQTSNAKTQESLGWTDLKQNFELWLS